MECNGKGRLYTALRGPGIGGKGKTEKSLDLTCLGAQMVAECLCLFGLQIHFNHHIYTHYQTS